MKTLITALFLLVFAAGANAQGVLIGVRSGSSYLMQSHASASKITGVEGQTMAWDKGFSVRVNRKRFTWEISLMHYTLENSWDALTSTTDQKNKNYDLSLGVQYNLSGQKQKRVRQFVGLSV